MARVELRHLRKRYPGVEALGGVDLDVASGEFFTLLGPSGCGKTTLLRTVAGFVRQDEGEVWIGGRRVDDVPVWRRDIGLVFQDYAIFPHMSVGDNVGFGLANRRRPQQEIAERVTRALDLVRLPGLGARMPHQLSGGQQQRVGLARAIVIEPEVLLMDEPLSNLDAKLRVEMRDDIRDLQHSLGITTLYVTHDQEEALVLSDRVCVMQAGRVHQVGAPWDIYARPETLFVASFVGAMNLIPDVRVGPLGEIAFGGAAGVVPWLAGRERVTLAIRLEDTGLVGPMAPSQAATASAVSRADADTLTLEGTVDKVSFAGREALCHVRLDGGAELAVHVHRPERATLAVAGARLRFAVPLSRLHAFDPATGRRIDGGAT